MKNFDQIPTHRYSNKQHYAAVYEITCEATGCNYIGSSINVRNRIIMHMGLLKRNKHTVKAMQADFNKYGIDVFRVDLIKAFTYTYNENMSRVKNKIRGIEDAVIKEKKPSYNSQRFSVCKLEISPLLKKALEAA